MISSSEPAGEAAAETDPMFRFWIRAKRRRIEARAELFRVNQMVREWARATGATVQENRDGTLTARLAGRLEARTGL